jgi:hypothetical protein
MKGARLANYHKPVEMERTAVERIKGKSKTFVTTTEWHIRGTRCDSRMLGLGRERPVKNHRPKMSAEKGTFVPQKCAEHVQPLGSQDSMI